MTVEQKQRIGYNKKLRHLADYDEDYIDDSELNDINDMLNKENV